jgi:hypothetical protein
MIDDRRGWGDHDRAPCITVTCPRDRPMGNEMSLDWCYFATLWNLWRKERILGCSTLLRVVVSDESS